jgi:hypothetical protein
LTEWLNEKVNEVEGMVAKLWTRFGRQRCGGERARWQQSLRCSVLCFSAHRGREKERIERGAS